MINIEELKRLEAVATEGRWHIVLGSGNCQCTAIHAEYDNGEGTMIADFLPDYFLSEKCDSRKTHVHDMRLVEALRNSAKELIALAEWAEKIVSRRGVIMEQLGKCGAGQPCFVCNDVIETLRNYPEFPKDGEK